MFLVFIHVFQYFDDEIAFCSYFFCSVTADINFILDFKSSFIFSN